MNRKQTRKKAKEENALKTLRNGPGYRAVNFVSFGGEAELINETVQTTEDTHRWHNVPLNLPAWSSALDDDDGDGHSDILLLCAVYKFS